MADRQFDYMLLDRLKRDCDYFLGACAEAAARGDSTVVGAERHLWAGSVESQIAKMRELFDMVPEKPEWLTEEDIDRYETAMRGLRDKGVDLRTGARAGSWKDRLVVIDTVEARLLGGETRTDALLFNPGNDHTPFIVAQGYDPATRSWSSGRYMHDLMDALCDLRGCTHPDFAITGMTPERIMADYGKGYEISPEQACEVAEDINDRLENAVVWELDVIDVEWYLLLPLRRDREPDRRGRSGRVPLALGANARAQQDHRRAVEDHAHARLRRARCQRRMAVGQAHHHHHQRGAARLPQRAVPGLPRPRAAAAGRAAAAPGAYGPRPAPATHRPASDASRRA